MKMSLDTESDLLDVDLWSCGQGCGEVAVLLPDTTLDNTEGQLPDTYPYSPFLPPDRFLWCAVMRKKISTFITLK